MRVCHAEHTMCVLSVIWPHKSHVLWGEEHVHRTRRGVEINRKHIPDGHEVDTQCLFKMKSSMHCTLQPTNRVTMLPILSLRRDLELRGPEEVVLLRFTCINTDTTIEKHESHFISCSSHPSFGSACFLGVVRRIFVPWERQRFMRIFMVEKLALEYINRICER